MCSEAKRYFPAVNAASNREHSGMSPVERRAALSLASIYSLRMLGMFMILPVFALYAAEHLPGATPALIGLAIGAYGITQAVLQIPARAAVRPHRPQAGHDRWSGAVRAGQRRRGRGADHPR